MPIWNGNDIGHREFLKRASASAFALNGLPDK
jgi:hypothetical protein